MTSHSLDIVPACAQLSWDGWRQHLIQQQFHR